MSGVSFVVNGQPAIHDGEDRTHLADYLREAKGLTGTHLGCEHGVCGACTLMMDGVPVRSCITYASACHGATIRTIEDFDDDPLMQKLRAAFRDHHGLQCGFCTPGMLASAYDIVLRVPEADDARIREELSGNLCRCTGYMGIVAAIRAVLQTGPHRAPDAPLRPVRIAAPRIEAAPPRISAYESTEETTASVAPPRHIPKTIENGTTLTRVLDLSRNTDDVWAVLTDIPTVADCLPGALIDTIHDDGTVDGAFGVALGPIKAMFRGTAFVSFDRATRSGTVSGSGGDAGTRSRAEGQLTFALMEAEQGSSRLRIDITYKLNGALAQFGRPRIVAVVVDQLLLAFTRNLVRHASAETNLAPPSGVLQRSLFSRIVALFTGQPRKD